MQYHNYIFFSCNPALHELPQKTQEKYKKEFLAVLFREKNSIVYAFATLGLKAQTNILLWFQSDSIETIQNLVNRLMHTDLGRYLTISHTLFGMARPTQYTGHGEESLDTTRKNGKYLIIYPFTKTQLWYQMDFDTRRKLMGGHIAIGKKHKTITQLLLYSYGVDDSEFIVSYETDDLLEFQTLVMELRSDTVRNYTLKDTPIFTCISKSLEEALTFL